MAPESDQSEGTFSQRPLELLQVRAASSPETEEAGVQAKAPGVLDHTAGRSFFHAARSAGVPVVQALGAAADDDPRGASLDTGETGGPAIEPRNQETGMPMLLSEAEGNTGHDVNRKSCSDPTRSKTLSMRRSSLYRNWEISSVPDATVMLAVRRAGRGRPMAAIPTPTLARSRMLA